MCRVLNRRATTTAMGSRGDMETPMAKALRRNVTTPIIPEAQLEGIGSLSPRADRPHDQVFR